MMKNWKLRKTVMMLSTLGLLLVATIVLVLVFGFTSGWDVVADFFNPMASGNTWIIPIYLSVGGVIITVTWLLISNKIDRGR